MRPRAAKIQEEAPERARAEKLGEWVKDRDSEKRTNREGERSLERRLKRS